MLSADPADRGKVGRAAAPSMTTTTVLLVLMVVVVVALLVLRLVGHTINLLLRLALLGLLVASLAVAMGLRGGSIPGMPAFPGAAPPSGSPGPAPER